MTDHAASVACPVCGHDHSDFSDPLATAIAVLRHVEITEPSARPDTEDAHNRVLHALGYLGQELERREQEAAVWAALNEWQELEVSPVRRSFDLDDAKDGLQEALAKYREQRAKYDRMIKGEPKRTVPRRG